MPRSPRIILSGVPVHVVQRGHSRASTFHAVDDFLRYRDTLHVASQRFGCGIHAYVFMTNHVHLLITPEEESGVAQVIQAIGRRYVRYVNARYKRTGALWEGRFRSSVVRSAQYLFTCHRYIELNPVRAAMVGDPYQYRWSSYRRNAHGDEDALITPHHVYQTLAPNAEERQMAYRALFLNPLEQQTIDRIRSAVYRGAELGSEQLF